MFQPKNSPQYDQSRLWKKKKKKTQMPVGVCKAAPPKKGLGQKTCSDV